MGASLARVDSWSLDTEAVSRLEARLEVKDDPGIALERELKVNASWFSGSSGKAENPVKIRSPRPSATYSMFPNLI